MLSNSRSQAKTFSFDENIFALVVIALVTVIVFGGIKRISSVMEKTVPFMAGIYLLGVLIILIMNYDNIIPSLTVETTKKPSNYSNYRV